MAKKKDELIAKLEDIAQYMEIVGENDFKVRAYRKGAAALQASDSSLEDVASGKVKVAGVGEGLKGAIQEFLKNGEIAQLTELMKQVPEGVLELMKLSSLGSKKAMVIQKELGVNTVGELEYACRENRLLALKGFGKAMQEKILKSIEDMNANSGKHRLDEAIAKITLIEKELRKHLGKSAEIIRVGAVGRHAEIVEELELYFTGTSENVGDAVGCLDWDTEAGLDDRRESPFGTDLAGFSGALKDGYRVTLWVSEQRPDKTTLQWLCADENLRDQIAENSSKFKDWEYSWLESEWVDAERTPGAQAYRRSRDGAVKGVFHCHTNFSDGAATLEQMVKGAESRGYEYIGISDHSQSAFYASGLKPERILEQNKMIKDLQKKVSIKIFHGVESDILAEGGLDYDQDVLHAFDFIVGSIHSRFKMDEDVMTKRLVAALKNPHITMWGHPTGRLILGRKGYGLDWDQCLAMAAANGVAIEFNANPHRLDVDWRMGAALEKFRVKVCINPDAHSVEGLDDTEYGEYMAEKSMIPYGNILNLMGANEMEKYLWERKSRHRH